MIEKFTFTIGTVLKLARVAKRWRQKDLAARLGIGAPYLSLIENGRREPSITLIRKFSKELGVPLGKLLWIAIDEPTRDERKP